jgi:CO/xanthine dehydrogenase FAD-binding subunit
MVNSVIAKTIQEALKALQSDAYVIVAGGTDMLIQNRSHTGMAIGFKKPVLYVNLIKEMDYIRSDETNLYIGANTRLETILRHQDTPKILKDIIGEMASPAIRHTATLAGNIANASPAGDSLVALYVLDAKVKIQRLGQSRLEKVSDFILGVRKVDLKIDEMITEIIIPKVSYDRIVFKKVAPRQSDAISKLSFVGAITSKQGLIQDIRFAFGAVYMTVVRSRTIEEKYVGWSLEQLKANVDQIINDYEPLIQPIDDQRSNRIYRKKVAINLIKDFILQS